MHSRTEQDQKHPERFDPETESGKLIDAEHRGRYLWAAQVAQGKTVLDAGCGLGYGLKILLAAGASEVAGVDIDAGAIEEASRVLNGDAASARRGNVCDLDFDQASFDLVVCFETIEHLEDAPAALAEFHRVLRPDGLLLVSSPNPDAYPPGNRHHVREYKPQELADLVSEHFGNVERYRQDASLISNIKAASGRESQNEGAGNPPGVLDSGALEPGHEAFGLVAAGDGALPPLRGFLAVAEPFELKWWSDQLAAARADAEAATVDAEAAVAAAKSDARETIAAIEERTRGQLAEQESALAAARQAAAAAEEKARERIGQLERDSQESLARAEERKRLAEGRAREASSSLLEANQELAQIPLLKHRLAELHEEHAQLWGRFNELEGSRSWRFTSPLRRFRAYFRFRH